MRRRGLLLGAVLVVSVLFTWQVASAWTDQDQEGVTEAAIGIRGLLAGRNAESTVLAGEGLAAGARGTLYYYERGVIGVMLLSDMPVLPESRVYEMWCVGPNGTVDASSIFNISADTQATTVVDISAPRSISAYVRIFVTIEPAGGSPRPAGSIVMQSQRPAYY